MFLSRNYRGIVLLPAPDAGRAGARGGTCVREMDFHQNKKKNSCYCIGKCGSVEFLNEKKAHKVEIIFEMLYRITLILISLTCCRY